MLNTVLRNIVRFIVLILTQVLVIKNIELGRFINPFIYVLFIITLPFETPRSLLLLIAFVTGISIDMFYDTMGMHAAASVFMAFCRPRVFRFFAPRDGYEAGTEPIIRYMGSLWFVSCSAVLIVLHHFFLFYLEVFRWTEFFSTFFRVFMSALFTLGLCTLSQYLVSRRTSG
ncbi:MAG: rod shape-determining protein MreD [Bacteroidia bacterium]|nr:rod shape-determining protein MreD [Bacteroidia bacterium]